MRGMGQAVMGTGIGQGENRAVEAAQRAISNPLLEDSSIEGAKGVIVNITGGPDLSLSEAVGGDGAHHQGGRPRRQRDLRHRHRRVDGQRGEGDGDRDRLQPQAAQGRATPVDLTNYMATPQADAAPAAVAGGGGRRLLPQDAEPEGRRRRGRASTSTCRLPAPQGRRRAGASSVAAFTREATCAECGREYLISGASVEPRHGDRGARALPLRVRRLARGLHPRQRQPGAGERGAQAGGARRSDAAGSTPGAANPYSAV